MARLIIVKKRKKKRAVITGMKTWGIASSGYSNNQSKLIDLVLKASNTNPTTNSWTGTTIGTIAQFSNTWAVNAKQTLGNANSVRYRYVWLEHSIGGGDLPFLDEVEFYETLGGSETKINLSGKTILYDGYDAAYYAYGVDGLFSGYPNCARSGSSRTVCRIGVDLGA